MLSELLQARCGAVCAPSTLCHVPSAAKRRAAGPRPECWGNSSSSPGLVNRHALKKKKQHKRHWLHFHGAHRSSCQAMSRADNRSPSSRGCGFGWFGFRFSSQYSSGTQCSCRKLEHRPPLNNVNVPCAALLELQQIHGKQESCISLSMPSVPG